MKTVVVSSADIAREGGVLDAETERLMGVAQRHLAAAEAIMAKIRAQL